MTTVLHIIAQIQISVSRQVHAMLRFGYARGLYEM
jgi:hypothetical protein